MLFKYSKKGYRIKQPYEVAIAWLNSISAQNEKECLALSHPDIQIHGPHGISKGHEVLKPWFTDAPMHIHILNVLEREYEVLVEHRIEWPMEHQSIQNAALLEIRDEKIFSYRRVEKNHFDEP